MTTRETILKCFALGALIAIAMTAALMFGGCAILRPFGVGDDESDAVKVIAEETLLKAAAENGVKLDRSTVKAFAKLIEDSPEIQAQIAKVIEDNKEHAEIRKLADKLAGGLFGE